MTMPTMPGYIAEADLDRIIAEKLAQRDAEHAAELEAVRARLPQLMVPMNSGGPGVDNHQRSWSLVEQQMAAAGEILDHWKGV